MQIAGGLAAAHYAVHTHVPFSAMSFPLDVPKKTVAGDCRSPAQNYSPRVAGVTLYAQGSGNRVWTSPSTSPNLTMLLAGIL
jgi:hypothetical protein